MIDVGDSMGQLRIYRSVGAGDLGDDASRGAVDRLINEPLVVLAGEDDMLTIDYPTVVMATVKEIFQCNIEVINV